MRMEGPSLTKLKLLSRSGCKPFEVRVCNGISLWFQFSFPSWLMILNTFSATCMHIFSYSHCYPLVQGTGIFTGVTAIMSKLVSLLPASPHCHSQRDAVKMCVTSCHSSDYSHPVAPYLSHCKKLSAWWPSRCCTVWPSCLRPHLLLRSPIDLHWLPCCSSDTSDTLPLQGLCPCCSLCLDRVAPDSLLSH